MSSGGNDGPSTIRQAHSSIVGPLIIEMTKPLDDIIGGRAMMNGIPGRRGWPELAPVIPACWGQLLAMSSYEAARVRQCAATKLLIVADCFLLRVWRWRITRRNEITRDTASKTALAQSKACLVTISILPLMLDHGC